MDPSIYEGSIKSMFSVRLYICILHVSGGFFCMWLEILNPQELTEPNIFFENLVQPYLGKERSKIEPLRFFRKIL